MVLYTMHQGAYDKVSEVYMALSDFAEKKDMK
jgi:effector-binding domain-containing protein